MLASKSALAAAILLLLLQPGGDVVAQDAVESPEESIRQLLARVESLEAEVRQLRAERSREKRVGEKERRGDEKNVRPVEQAAPSAPEEDGMPALKTAEPLETFPQLKIRGFGDVDYHWGERGADRNAFRLGQLDLFLTSQLAENVDVLSENVIEADEDNHFGIEIERLLLQYTPRDYFNIAVGRYHTAIGYYNEAYHHGKWLQTAVGRPAIFAFEDEGGLLPIHNVGVKLNGAIPSGRLGLHYVAEIGNGRRYEPGEESVQNLSDNNDFKAVNLALFARPDWLSGLQAGASIYFDRVSVSSLPTVSQTIVAAHAVYVSPAFEWLNEGVLIHDTSGFGTFDTVSFYTQIARRFGPFRPFVRYQFLDADENDPIVERAGRQSFSKSLSLGVRYDFTSLAALKVQLDHPFGASTAGNELTVQTSFTF